MFKNNFNTNLTAVTNRIYHFSMVRQTLEKQKRVGHWFYAIAVSSSPGIHTSFYILRSLWPKLFSGSNFTDILMYKRWTIFVGWEVDVIKLLISILNLQKIFTVTDFSPFYKHVSLSKIYLIFLHDSMNQVGLHI